MLNLSGFLSTLGVMGIGMLGIFVVTASVVLSIKALNSVSDLKDKMNK